jgi:hypothetical protein
VDDAAVVLRPTAEKEAVDEAAVRKAVEDAAAVERATVDKKVADVAMMKKVDSVYHSSPWEVLLDDFGNGYHMLQDVDGGPPEGAVGRSGNNHHQS